MAWARLIPQCHTTLAWWACTGPARLTWRCTKPICCWCLARVWTIGSLAILRRFAPHARIVHFEIDPAQLDRVRSCDMPVIGDLARDHPSISRAIRKRFCPTGESWRAIACGQDRAELDPRGLAQPTIRFLDELFSRLPKDSIVLADVGQHQMWAAQRYHSRFSTGLYYLRRSWRDGFRFARCHWRAVGKTGTESFVSPATAASR